MLDHVQDSITEIFPGNEEVGYIFDVLESFVIKMLVQYLTDLPPEKVSFWMANFDNFCMSIN